jgi:hypothetical protein
VSLDALPHAARELTRISALKAAQADHLDIVMHDAAPL